MGRAFANTAGGAPGGAPGGVPVGTPSDTPASTPALETRGLAVGHGAHPFVSDVSISVAPGEVVALIGPNGSGKTTIIRTLAGQLAPLAGSIRLLGEDIRTVPRTEMARTLAVMLTARPHTELVTCQDIVEAGRHPYTGRLGILSDADHERVRETMEATGVWELRHRDFAHMSDGQRQRTLLARALAQDPRVLLLDEPTSYLDIRAQIEMLELLRAQARERGTAVIASLHEIDLAQKAADRVVCIRDGAVVRQGTPDEVFHARAITGLYGLDETSYQPLFGSFELTRPAGAPKVFVVAGAGTGAACFRQLQRRGIPFAAGVLFAHDADGLLAASLATEAVLAPDFEPIDDATLARARALAARCPALIVCRERFGTLDARNAELIEATREAGTPVFSSAAAFLAARGDVRGDAHRRPPR